MMDMEYFTDKSADQFSFIHIPKTMVSSQVFSTLSTDAKIVYGLLLDRLSMVTKNNWIDVQGRAYIIYSVDDIQDDIHFTRFKVKKCLKELEDIGLLESLNRGRCLPPRLYVKNFVPVKSDENAADV